MSSISEVGSGRGRHRMRLWGGVLLLSALLYGLLCLGMYVRQDALVFYPQPAATVPPPAPGRLMESLEVRTQDGVALRGWLMTAEVGARTADRAAKTPLMIYFGGNAEEVSYLVGEPRWPAEWAVLFFNYRGYGSSEGQPSEAALYRDALSIYDMAAARPDVDSGRIALMGRSLGTGVATFVAATRRVSKVVLVSPYDSLVNVADEHYPWLPVGALLAHRFDSVARAPSIRVPMIALIAPGDRTVSVARTRALLSQWGGPSLIQEIVGARHDSFGRFELYWRSIREFLRSDLPRAARDGDIHAIYS